VQGLSSKKTEAPLMENPRIDIYTFGPKTRPPQKTVELWSCFTPKLVSNKKLGSAFRP